MTHSTEKIAYAEYLLATGCPYRDITASTGICATSLRLIKQRMQNHDPTLPPAWEPPAGGAQTEEEDEPAPSRCRMLRGDATGIPTLSVTGAELTNLYKVRDPAELLVVMAFSAAYNAAIKANETLADADKPLAEKQMAVSMMVRAISSYVQAKGVIPPESTRRMPTIIRP